MIAKPCCLHGDVHVMSGLLGKKIPTLTQIVFDYIFFNQNTKCNNILPFCLHNLHKEELETYFEASQRFDSQRTYKKSNAQAKNSRPQQAKEMQHVRIGNELLVSALLPNTNDCFAPLFQGRCIRENSLYCNGLAVTELPSL